MRRLVSIAALSMLSLPVAGFAQIAEVELPPSDVAGAGVGYDYDADYGADDHDPEYKDTDHSRDDDRVYDRRGGAYADALPDGERIADTMTVMLRALMDLRVGPLADAARRIDPDADISDIAEDDTLRDLASRGDPDFEERLEDDIRRNAATAEEVARRMAEMMPAFIAMARDFGAQAKKPVEDRRGR